MQQFEPLPWRLARSLPWLLSASADQKYHPSTYHNVYFGNGYALGSGSYSLHAANLSQERDAFPDSIQPNTTYYFPKATNVHDFHQVMSKNPLPSRSTLDAIPSRDVISIDISYDADLIRRAIHAMVGNIRVVIRDSARMEILGMSMQGVGLYALVFPLTYRSYYDWYPKP